ncbi:LacI family DNA-binding transcriptional regulator [Streptacidiphilus sp. N1-12]|uniref:LacI family DNA-binding transcriptional regulator n=2 Tax=Streptacidiphilus alkalitolerans TaxID=3342712 RepID=A0ABV6WEI4_9ACTN
MGYPEKRSGYYRGRYKIEPGRYGTVSDEDGATIRFQTAREARQAANDKEAELRVQAKTAKAVQREKPPVPTFGTYVNETWWPQQQELAESTLEGYLDHIQGHLLPTFNDVAMDEITRSAIDVWEALKKQSYAASSAATYRSILHTILADAIEDGTRPGPNPAARRRGRGRRTGRLKHRRPEKAVTDPLGILLIGERASLLSGRDDEFVQVVSAAYTGMRWGETIGLDRKYKRPREIRVEQQLYQLRTGRWILCPPKDDSYRTLDVPGFLDSMLDEHIRRTQPAACPCHQVKTVFTSARATPGTRILRADIAREAGVSHPTVSRVLLHPEMTSVSSRIAVHLALQHLQALHPPVFDPHWRRSDWAYSIFTPAARGWFPSRGPGHEEHPVAVVEADVWPGKPVTGRYSADQAEVSWLPVALGLTTHGERHCHRTWMEDLGTRKVLMDERMGHIDGSTGGRYAHVTQGMRDRLMAGLTEMWEESLTARLAISPRSRVQVLDVLLQRHAAKIFSQNSPLALIS